MLLAEPRRSRWLLGGGLVAAFAASAVVDLRILGGAFMLTALVFRAGALRVAGKVARTVVPVTAALSIGSWAWLRLVRGAPVAIEPFFALMLRASLISFLMLSVLARVDLFRALSRWPMLTRLLVVTLAQIHALRLLATESFDGLRSRLPRRPGPVDVVRGASGITGALFTLSARNARDVADAMRSRGFS